MLWERLYNLFHRIPLLFVGFVSTFSRKGCHYSIVPQIPPRMLRSLICWPFRLSLIHCTKSTGGECAAQRGKLHCSAILPHAHCRKWLQLFLFSLPHSQCSKLGSGYSGRSLKLTSQPYAFAQMLCRNIICNRKRNFICIENMGGCIIIIVTIITIIMTRNKVVGLISVQKYVRNV